VSFDFWNSYQDQQDGDTEIGAYEVLSCISSDINTPKTLEEFCSEFGYDRDSRRAEATWRRCEKFARRLREFFPVGAEREGLAEIQ
jgi:hypothetical protein